MRSTGFRPCTKRATWTDAHSRSCIATFPCRTFWSARSTASRALSDFGVAKSALGSVRTEEGVFVGKLPYFPPEYLRREPVGVPLDVYALGVTLWHALTRRELWEDADDAQVMRAILDDGVPPLRGVRGRCSADRGARHAGLRQGSATPLSVRA